VKRLTSKLKRISREWWLIDFNNCMKWAKFLTKDSNLPTRGLTILCRKPASLWHGEPIELTIGLKGMLDLCTFRRPYKCGCLLWYGDCLNFRSARRAFCHLGCSRKIQISPTCLRAWSKRHLGWSQDFGHWKQQQA
jgi:hypothetical protein